MPCPPHSPGFDLPNNIRTYTHIHQPLLTNLNY
jgi:hypothetical protein